jgi:ubiquitin-protein ligase
MPSFSDIRFFHGCIFLRRGVYRDGAFRFTVKLPPDYSSINSHPEIRFTPPIFNPLVDHNTGILDLKVQCFYFQIYCFLFPLAHLRMT